MGLLDGALGQVAGSLLGGKDGASGEQAQDLLGGLLKQLGGGAGGGSAQGLMAAAVALLHQQGGLEGIVKKLQSGGLGDAVQSWIGTGANASVSASQLQSALGGDVMKTVASHAGVSEEEAGNGLASVLPELVNRLTPDGQIPSNGADMLKSLSGLLGK